MEMPTGHKARAIERLCLLQRLVDWCQTSAFFLFVIIIIKDSPLPLLREWLGCFSPFFTKRLERFFYLAFVRGKISGNFKMDKK